MRSPWPRRRTTPVSYTHLDVYKRQIPFATVSYFGLERPLLRLKNRIRWWDAPKAPPGPPSPPMVTTELPAAAVEST